MKPIENFYCHEKYFKISFIAFTLEMIWLLLEII